MTIPQFKQAFITSAERQNPKIRWGAPKKIWQTQTELSGVKTALDNLERARVEDRAQRIQEVRTEMQKVSAKRQNKYAEALTLVEDELKTTVVKIKRTITGPPRVRKKETMEGKYSFATEDDEGGERELGGGLTKTRADFVENLVAELRTLESEIGCKIDDRVGLIESVLKDTKMGANSSSVDQSVWAEAIAHVKETVIPGIKNDMAELSRQGLLGKGAKLKGLRFTGSDFHKGGKQVLILRFADGGGEKKIAYKPSNLQVDALLFGKGSVAEKLGASTYNIVPCKTDDDPPADYGYMEFVDTQGGPTDAQDVMSLYKSVAGAMAMSYYVGLEDVHHENILIKKDAIQVIDMEATTGMFAMPSDDSPETGGFIDQQWGDAIHNGLGGALSKLIASGKLTELPDDDAIEKVMCDEFSRVAAAWDDDTLRDDLEELEEALKGQKTRIVPLATRGLQDTIPAAQANTYKAGDEEKPRSLKNWIWLVNKRLAKEGEEPNTTMLSYLKGTTSTPLPTVRNLIVSPGAYKALVRGDVPYYLRDLGSSDIYDEDGNKIDAPGLKKVGRDIATEMAERRTASPAAALKVFKAQGVANVRKLNTDLRRTLPQG
jgi:hypothetical protein